MIPLLVDPEVPILHTDLSILQSHPKIPAFTTVNLSILLQWNFLKWTQKYDFKNYTFIDGAGGASLPIGCREVNSLDGEDSVAKCAWESAVWMFGSVGGVFSVLDLDELKFEMLDLCLEMDLGRRFRIDEADMVPKNRVSMVSALWLDLMAGWLGDRTGVRS